MIKTAREAAMQNEAMTPEAVPEHDASAQRLRAMFPQAGVGITIALAMLLEVFGHRVAVAHDGEEALRRYQAQRPEVVLLDIGIPGLDGYEVARRIRGFGRPVTLVTLTGWGQAADKARALEAGFDLHFTKPVDPDQIIELLATQP